MPIASVCFVCFCFGLAVLNRVIYIILLGSVPNRVGIYRKQGMVI